ncbi:MAG: hypothetical protein Q9159_003777 [Coniocarpon cinnabarinum]
MSSNKGIPFLATDWALMVLTLVGSSLNILEVRNGLGTHKSTIPPAEYAEDQQWEYIAWVMVFISFFFLRASVMLFVLRLLPPFKKWQQKVVYVAFVLNVIITIIATVSYGVSCIPFRAAWQEVPGSKCFSKKVLVATQKMNGGLACVIDITVAIVPAFLLWNVQMRRHTKLILDVLFGLGLITAALSIGRAAAISYEDLTTDTTWKLMPNKWFGMVEEKLGIIFACGPAVRQFFAYRSRTGSWSPAVRRDAPNADFTKMRRRITLRDVFWYRPMALRDDARSGPTSKGLNPESEQTKVPAEVDATAATSVLDTWWGRLYRALPGTSSKSRGVVDTGQLKENKKPLTAAATDDGGITQPKLKRWSFRPRQGHGGEGSNATSAPFLFTQSGNSGRSGDSGMGTGLRSGIEREEAGLGEVLADPVRSLAPADQRR